MNLKPFCRALAVAHLLFGLLFAMPALWMLGSSLASGRRSIGSLVAWSVPMLLAAAAALWFIQIAVRLWRRSPRWPSVLLRTHVPLAVVVALLFLQGFLAIRGAERSAAHGGGLLGGLGYLFFGAGIVLATLVIPSLLLAGLASTSRDEPGS